MISTIVGKRGKGKTTLAKNLIQNNPEFTHIHILDYLGEYWDLKDDRITLVRDNLYGFCQFAWNSSDPKFKTLVIFDEIDLYGKKNQYISFLYRYGRHKNIDIIAIARRFYDLPVIVRFLTEKYYLFQITEKRDLDYIKESVDLCFMIILKYLDTFQYLIKSF